MEPVNATALIKFLHNTPRLLMRPGFRFEWVKALPFDPVDTSAGGYWESIILTSLIPTVLGVALLLILVLWAYCRVIICCCKTSPRRMKESYKSYLRCMSFFLIAALLTAFMGFVGDLAIDYGFTKVEIGVKNVTNILTPIKTIAQQTSLLDEAMQNNLNRVRTCQWPQAEKQLEEMKTEAMKFGKVLDNVAVSTSNVITFILNLDVDSFINKYAVDRRIIFGFPLAFVLLIGCISFFSTSCAKSKYALRCTFVCLTPLCILVLLVAASFEIGASLCLSDICIDPDKVALGLASSPQPPSKDQHHTLLANNIIYDEIKYYLTCTGTSPIHDYVVEANNTLFGFRTKLNEWIIFCDSSNADPAVTNLINELNSAMFELNKVDEMIKCKRINTIWKNVVGTALCNSAISGFSILSIAQTLCAFPWLYVCIIAASFVWRRLPYQLNVDERRRLSNLLEDAGIEDGNNNNGNDNSSSASYEVLLDDGILSEPINNNRHNSRRAITNYERRYTDDDMRRAQNIECDDEDLPVATNIVAIHENGVWT